MFQIQFKRRNYGVLSLLFCCIFLGGLLFSFFIFDKILIFGIKQKVTLEKGRYERELYEFPPFPLTLKVYIFHILNKDEVHNGAKPHLQQIGPYVFDEYIWKNNISDNKADDTMQFNLWRKYVYRRDLSNGLTGEEIVTTLHPVITTIGLTVHFQYRQFIHVGIAAIKELFHEPEDAFWTGRAMNLLFDGIEIDCSTTNPLAKLACAEISKNKSPTIQLITTKKMKFSLLGGYNYTSSGHWKVKKGGKNIREAGQIVEVDGQSELKVWSDGKCNKINGTDGVIFSPLIRPHEPLSFYVKQICASLHLKYTRKAMYRGVHLSVYTEKFERMSAENMSCFCREPNYCPLKGTMDLFPCVQAPITISLPHFLDGDPSLLANIASGLQPVRKKHEFHLSIEKYTGVALRSAGRVQINFELEPVKEIAILAKLTKMIFPWIWFEEYADVPDFLVNLLKYTVSLGKKFNSMVAWITLTIGSVGAITCFVLFLLMRYTSVDLIEAEGTFKKSPQFISKLGEIMMVSELKPKENINTDENVDKDTDAVHENGNNMPSTGAVLLLDEVVSKAVREVKKSKLQGDFDDPRSTVDRF